MAELSDDELLAELGRGREAEIFGNATRLVLTGEEPAGGVENTATLGVVGPTYMDYPSTIAAVRAVARYVGRFLAEG